ncbi:hypothetical protein GIY23_04305 [Allosaccharopolyspora coralli]|uniref:Uncharacterized protein n=1 Tax=Allosaccharopolyspora coralli TaxID=2665642 RepID=A0A5Q3QDL8_9PSEU|nr:hypothetical protein [Allosaccharopolyspora coralli]QGK68867.1 hypothetical protein GIY23_04305 [Allosaccharopolyspora coralli]
MVHPHEPHSHPENDPGSALLAATTFTVQDDEPVHSLDQVRHYMDLLGEAIAEHDGAPWERDEALWRVRELVDDLAEPTPSARRVKARWIRLAPLVESLLPEVSVTEITRLINEVL